VSRDFVSLTSFPNSQEEIKPKLSKLVSPATKLKQEMFFPLFRAGIDSHHAQSLGGGCCVLTPCEEVTLLAVSKKQCSALFQ